MKKVVLMIAVIMSFVPIIFGFSNTIEYQGRLREQEIPVTGTRNMIFKVYNQSIGSVPLWASSDLTVNISTGVFSCSLTPEIDWRAGDYWIETSVGNKTYSPRQKISPQIFAIHSKTSEGVSRESGVINFNIADSTRVIVSQTGTQINGNLTIGGNLRLTTGKIVFSDLSEMTSAGISSTAQLINSQDSVIRSDSDNDGTGDIVFSNGVNERMRIKNTGFVGIGTSLPGEKLTVWGGIGSFGSASAEGRVCIGADDGTDVGIYTDGNRNLKLDAGNNIWFNKKVGIGTANPETILDVVGNIKTTGNITVGGTVDGRDLSADGIKIDELKEMSKRDSISGGTGGDISDGTITNADISAAANILLSKIKFDPNAMASWTFSEYQEIIPDPGVYYLLGEEESSKFRIVIDNVNYHMCYGVFVTMGNMKIKAMDWGGGIRHIYYYKYK